MPIDPIYRSFAKHALSNWRRPMVVLRAARITLQVSRYPGESELSLRSWVWRVAKMTRWLLTFVGWRAKPESFCCRDGDGKLILVNDLPTGETLVIEAWDDGSPEARERKYGPVKPRQNRQKPFRIRNLPDSKRRSGRA